MKTYEFNEIIKENTVMALGYFDAIHIGHKALLKRAVELSKKYNATATALIFTGSFKGNGEVFTFNERLNRIENSNVSSVVYANLNEKFLSFWQEFFINFDIIGCFYKYLWYNLFGNTKMYYVALGGN